MVTTTSVHGVVLLVDHFGNLVTNIDRRAFETLARDHQVTVTVGGSARSAASSPPTPTFVPGEICALFGSTDHLEIAANGGSAEAALALSRGAIVRG